MVPNKLAVGTAAALFSGAAAWYAVEEKKHHSMQAEKHTNHENLEWLTVQQLECQDACTTTTSKHLISVAKTLLSYNLHLPPNSCTVLHPSSQTALLFTDKKYKPINLIPLKIEVLSKFLEIKMDWDNLVLFDSTAFTGSTYDIYPEKRIRVAVDDTNLYQWHHVIQVLEVSNYWYPEYNFKIYFTFEIRITEENRIEVRNVQLDVDEMISNKSMTVTSTLRSRVFKSKLLIQTSNSNQRLKTTIIALPENIGGKLVIKTIRQMDKFMMVFEFDVPGFTWINQTVTRDATIGMATTPIVFQLRKTTSGNTYYLFAQYQITESGGVKWNWLSKND